MVRWLGCHPIIIHNWLCLSMSTPLTTYFLCGGVLQVSTFSCSRHNKPRVTGRLENVHYYWTNSCFLSFLIKTYWFRGSLQTTIILLLKQNEAMAISLWFYLANFFLYIFCLLSFLFFSHQLQFQNLDLIYLGVTKR